MTIRRIKSDEELEREASEQIRAEIELAHARAADKQALWGSDMHVAMSKLCKMFPTLVGAPGTEPWDAMRLLNWLLTSGARTSGNTHAVKFALQVWNSTTDWQEWARKPVEEEGLGLDEVDVSPFNVANALSVWDEAHAKAFRTWVHTPFWP